MSVVHRTRKYPASSPVGVALVLVTAVLLLAGCAPLQLPSLGGLTGAGPTRTVTILYTGYGQGEVDANNPCT